jgi:hypothetical protein
MPVDRGLRAGDVVSHKRSEAGWRDGGRAPEDRGYAGDRRDRYRLTYRATAGGSGEGDWIIFETETGQATAYQLHVYGAPRSFRQDRERVERVRELLAAENERARTGARTAVAA